MATSLITSSIDGGINVLDVVIPTVVTGAGTGGHAFEGADFKNQCSPNSVIKYFNLTIQSAIKSSEAEFRPGWIEYAFLRFDNYTATPTVPAGLSASTGTETFPNLCKTWFRGNCVWTGTIPISVETPVAQLIKIKVPDKWCKNMRGSYWQLWVMFRSSKSTDTVTTIRNISSAQYKVYI